MIGMKEIERAYDIDSVSETYPGEVEITDLKDVLGTEGHVLVVRGDKAYADRLGEHKYLANPKFWLYENIINSQRVQEQLEAYPEHKLFDGVGYSSLVALGYHANRIDREAVAVMAREMRLNKKSDNVWDVKILYGTGPMEEGYVAKQKEVLSKRKDLIPMHQALYGAQALAPVGNKVVSMLEEMAISPDETFWTSASGSNLHGIGTKIAKRFGSRTLLIEPEGNPTIPLNLNLSDPKAIKDFARYELDNYNLSGWDHNFHDVAPLHVAHVNRYLLLNWMKKGSVGFDETTNVSIAEIVATQKTLRDINQDYDWTKTTAVALAPAIKSAEEGKNVLVMSYGKNRLNKLVDMRIPWLFREGLAQKVTLGVMGGAVWSAAGISYMINSNPDVPSFFPVP